MIDRAVWIINGIINVRWPLGGIASAIRAAVAQERERCARIAESMANHAAQSSWYGVAREEIAAAIRAEP